MSTQKDANRAIRNGVLLAGLLDLIAVGIGLVINFISYWFSDKIVLNERF